MVWGSRARMEAEVQLVSLTSRQRHRGNCGCRGSSRWIPVSNTFGVWEPATHRGLGSCYGDTPAHVSLPPTGKSCQMRALETQRKSQHSELHRGNRNGHLYLVQLSITLECGFLECPVGAEVESVLSGYAPDGCLQVRRIYQRPGVSLSVCVKWCHVFWCSFHAPDCVQCPSDRPSMSCCALVLANLCLVVRVTRCPCVLLPRLCVEPFGVSLLFHFGDGGDVRLLDEEPICLLSGVCGLFGVSESIRRGKRAELVPCQKIVCGLDVGTWTTDEPGSGFG